MVRTGDQLVRNTRGSGAAPDFVPAQRPRATASGVRVYIKHGRAAHVPVAPELQGRAALLLHFARSERGRLASGLPKQVVTVVAHVQAVLNTLQARAKRENNPQFRHEWPSKLRSTIIKIPVCSSRQYISIQVTHGSSTITSEMSH